MKYHLEINGDRDTLAVAKDDEDCLIISTSAHQYEVTARRIDRHHLILTVGGLTRNVYVIGGDEAKQIWIDGVVYQVVDADAKVLAAAATGDDRKLPREVTPPMPSVVVKVLVEPEQAVQKGEGLVVVSAMKMETTLTAPFDARVACINVAEGDKVMPGDILVDLEAGEFDQTPDGD